MGKTCMKIKNWNKFQHFKDRRPPWIKLHRDILEQRDINMISDRSFRVLVGLWLLASEDEAMEGGLPPIDDIEFRLRIPKSQIQKALTELDAFVIQDDIKAISERYQDDEPETETETETEGEGEDHTHTKKTHLEFVKLTDDEHAKLVKELGEGQTQAYIGSLNDYIGSKGKKYKSHYHTIMSWHRRDMKDGTIRPSSEKCQCGKGPCDGTGMDDAGHKYTWCRHCQPRRYAKQKGAS